MAPCSAPSRASRAWRQRLGTRAVISAGGDVGPHVQESGHRACSTNGGSLVFAVLQCRGHERDSRSWHLMLVAGPCRLAWLRQTKRLESKVDGRPHRTVAFITGPVHVKTFQPASKQSTRARARQISSAEKEISAHHRSCPCGSTHDAGAPYANKTHRRPTGDEHAPDASSRSSAAHRRGERRTPAPCRSVVAVQARRLPVARFPRRAQSRRRRAAATARR
jgi:hypothetical protein